MSITTEIVTPSTAITSSPPVDHRTFTPVARGERLANLDFARGIALLGILLVNVSVMFGPLAALMDTNYLSGQSASDRTASLLVKSFCQSKFISIFSLLFGYGLFSQIERAAANGRSPAGFTFRRLGVLALFGMTHALFIWFGDVLFIYACIGAWLLLARRAKTRTILIIGLCLLLVSVLIVSGLMVASVVFQRPEPVDRPQPVAQNLPEWMPNGLRAIIESGGNPGSPQWIEAEKTAYAEGPWIEAQVFRTVGWLTNLAVTAILIGWQVLGMFFLGAVLWRVRFFAPEQRELRWRVCRICLPLGLAFEGAAGYFFWGYPPNDARALMYGQIIHQVGLYFLPLGYLSGLALLADRLPELMRGPVASAGRMSLTVYLSESLIATALAYHWGLGIFGKVGSLQQVGLAFAIWTTLVVFSHLWQTFVGTGPMEWLWRRLEYGRTVERPLVQPLTPVG